MRSWAVWMRASRHCDFVMALADDAGIAMAAAARAAAMALREEIFMAASLTAAVGARQRPDVNLTSALEPVDVQGAALVERGVDAPDLAQASRGEHVARRAGGGGAALGHDHHGVGDR